MPTLVWRCAIAALLASFAFGVPLAGAQEKYPSRPINFIVPWGAGGGADQTARAAAQLLEPILGVSLPVVNVPGATGQSGMAKFLASPADGYTIQI
ncbi:MAG: tripartite tricarboxylate transporter substrate binding protein, partial [Burkholderiales bacterium]